MIDFFLSDVMESGTFQMWMERLAKMNVVNVETEEEESFWIPTCEEDENELLKLEKVLRNLNL